jgi:hypothetical protein
MQAICLVCGARRPQLKRRPLGSSPNQLYAPMGTPALLFTLGASGAGKTTAVQALEARVLPGVRCYYFDSIGVPPPEVLEKDWGGGERWQEHATRGWIERLVVNTDGAQVAVLDGQMRPSFIEPELARAGVHHARMVLLDCAPEVRAERLRGPRAQPDLASRRMEEWAAHLRGQADALGLRVLNTSRLSIEAMADALQQEVEVLRRAAQAAA